MSIRLVATIVQKSYMNFYWRRFTGGDTIPEELHESLTGGDSQDGETSDE